MHEVGSNDFGDTATTIARHHAILPNPSQKVASFALISADDMAVWFVDKEREIRSVEGVFSMRDSSPTMNSPICWDSPTKSRSPRK